MMPQVQAGSIDPTVPATAGSHPHAPSLTWRAVVFPLKLLWGMLFCQSLAGSILVVGWTYRLAQRSAFKFWFSRSGRPLAGLAFTQFLAEAELTQAQVHWPNWFTQQNFRQAARFRPDLSLSTHLFRLLRAVAHSLWLNFWIGLRAIANTWVLTLPACLFWWFGWYDGWNNSFNKGYEQAVVGPMISLLGIGCFIAAMFYIPLAQARQAVTGQWRCFYQFRFICKLARDRWVYCVLLALLFSLLNVPLSILKTSPMFWMHSSAALGTLTNAQAVAMLKGYFFWCALAVLPAFVILHVVAARIYASGVLSLVRSGKVAASELAPAEREVLDRLGLLAAQTEPQRHAFVRLVAWTGTRLGRAAGAIMLVVIWFSFVAQIYVAQFVNYHSGLGWINQPLVQLPWFRYFPAAVRNPLADISTALLVLMIAVLIRSIARSFRPSKTRPGAL
jgi:hypothetical protein